MGHPWAQLMFGNHLTNTVARGELNTDVNLPGTLFALMQAVGVSHTETAMAYFCIHDHEYFAGNQFAIKIYVLY